MELIKCDIKKARKCVYGLAETAPVTACVCNYCQITGKLRGCPPDKCDKFERVSRSNPKKRIPFEI